MRQIPPREIKQFAREKKLRFSRHLYPTLHTPSASPTSLRHPPFGLSPRAISAERTLVRFLPQLHQGSLPRLSCAPLIPTSSSLCSASRVHLGTRARLDNCVSLSNCDRFSLNLTFETNDDSNLFRM